MKFDLRIRMDEELTEILCENVWEKDIHPYWKDNVWVWIFKILFAIWAIGYTGLISLACILGYRLEIYMGNMGVYLVEEVGVCLFCSIIWLVTAHQEINAYGRWEKKMNRCMKNVGNTIYITDQKIHAVFREKEMEWNWEQLEWYRSYPQVLLLCMEGYYIYLDVTRLEKEERTHLYQAIQKTGQKSLTDEINTNVHLTALKKLYRYGKHEKNDL